MNEKKYKKSFLYWRYLGYDKETLKKYETEVAKDNYRLLARILPAATVITLAEIIFICLFAYSDKGVTDSLLVTMHILIFTEIAILVVGLVYYFVRNKQNVVLYSRIFTTTILTLWSILYIVIGTCIDPEDYAVLACGLFLLIQVMFNSYPIENLVFVLCAYLLFALMSFFNKTLMVFIYDIIDSFPFLVVGLFLSWAKSHSKWSSLINADAKVQLKTQQLENELLTGQVAVMLSQIQPHFLYNSLMVIKALCRKDPELAEKVTDDFSNYLRGNLDSLSSNHPIRFSQELEHTKIFLNLEKMQYGDKLDIFYDIQSDAFLIPTLTLQPIAENAVKYGFKQKEHITVKISSYEDEKGYCITVEDDGPGFDENSSCDNTKSHIGINNVRNRLGMQAGSNLEIKSVIGEGTKVVITIPKERVEQ